MQKKISIIILIATAIVLGFLRDYIFVSINHLIETGQDSGSKLSIIKWVLTLLFSVLYLVNTCAVLFALFKSRKYIKIAIFLYVFLVAISCLAAMGGYLFSSFEKMYPLIRAIMGIAQSPIVMIVLIPACLLDKKMFVKNSQDA